MKVPWSKRFWCPGSPLHGKAVPLDWRRLSGPAKRRALVACGLAPDYEAACRTMGLHAAAVTRQRRERLERMRETVRELERRAGE